MDPNEALYRIFTAVALGALVGLEREFTQKSAGLRTHILVTLGATVFTIVSLSDFYQGLHHMPFAPTDDNRIVRDPTRVAAQIVAGIGFIGGGAVLRHGTTVRGLTTAASLWTMASIGMMVGIGQYYLSVVATLLTFVVLFTIGRIERHFFSKSARTFNRMRVQIATHIQEAPALMAWMEERFEGRIMESRTRTDLALSEVDVNWVLQLDNGKPTVNDVSREIHKRPGLVSSSVKSYYENEDAS